MEIRFGKQDGLTPRIMKQWKPYLKRFWKKAVAQVATIFPQWSPMWLAYIDSKNKKGKEIKMFDLKITCTWTTAWVGLLQPVIAVVFAPRQKAATALQKMQMGQYAGSSL